MQMIANSSGFSSKKAMGFQEQSIIYHPTIIWACAWQNQQNGQRAQLRLRSAWTSTLFDQSLLCTQWVAIKPTFLYADSEDSDQTDLSLRWAHRSFGWFCHAVAHLLSGPRQANLVLIAYASSEGSGEPAHPRSLARTSAARSYKQWVKRNLQTESQISGLSEWLGMRS